MYYVENSVHDSNIIGNRVFIKKIELLFNINKKVYNKTNQRLELNNNLRK